MLIKSEGIPVNKKVHPGNFKGWIVADRVDTGLIYGALKLILKIQS